MSDQPIVRRDDEQPVQRVNIPPAIMSLSRMTKSKPATTTEEALVQALACFSSNYPGLFTVAPNSVLLWLEIIGPGASPELIAVAALAHMGDTRDGPDGHTIGYWPPRASDIKGRVYGEMQKRARLNPSQDWRP